MLTLLTEARLWTCREDIKIKDTNLGAFKYLERKESSLYASGKRIYAESRGIKHIVDNKRPIKLKNCLKHLEEYLKQYKIVYCQWKDNVVLRLMLSNGLLIHICINIFTGDILRMAFDKYFIGKIVSEQITDVIITRMHILIAYSQNQITFVYLQKPSMKRSVPEKISRMEPKIFNIIIGGPHGRKLPRNIACNNSFDLVAIWTRSSQNEVYPWRPTIRDQDMANIHIYKLSRTKLEPVCYYWTENDPICIEFSRINQNQLRTVEQKVSRKGEVTIENSVYEINKSKLQRIAVTSIPLQTQVCCHSYSPDHEKLMLGCIDGSVVLFDEGRGITHLVKAAFIPTIISWHCDSALVVIANERCQFQCFDISLSCIKNQLISEDITPSNLLDLSNYFSSQPTLWKMCWNKKPELVYHNEKYSQTDSYLLLLFDNGPVACLRFFGGGGLKGDIHTSGFTADVLVHSYLSLNQIEKAINILLCLNWDTYGAMCLISLHKIANYIFKMHLTPDREIQLQKALGSFHVPVKPLCEETEMEFGEQIKDITRKFFQYLLRYRSYEKAFSLGIDINDDDLFMDLHNAAKLNGDVSMAQDAYKKAEEILTRSDSRQSSHSTCSHSSCSICTTNSISSTENLTTNGSSSGNHQPDVVECSFTNPAEGQYIDNYQSAFVASATSSPVKRLLSSSTPITAKVTASSSSTSTANSSKSSGSLEHPPLPTLTFSNEQNTSVTLYREKSYIPPLPYTKNTLQNQNIRIRIPKPELKISTNSLTSASVYSRVQTNKFHLKSHPHMNNDFNNSIYSKPLYNSHDNILLSDPPLPKFTQKLSYNSGGSQDLFNDFSIKPTRSLLSQNSFSTDYLDKFNATENYNPLTVSQASTRHLRSSYDVLGSIKPPKALPRSIFPQEHVVIDVIPKPQPPPGTTTQSLNRSQNVLDQTLGIPLTLGFSNNVNNNSNSNSSVITTHHSFLPRASAMHSFPTLSLFNSKSLLKSESMQGLNTASSIPTVFHQYPLISGNIPAAFSTNLPSSSTAQSSQHNYHHHQGKSPTTKQAPLSSATASRNIKETSSILSNPNLHHQQQLQQMNQGPGSSIIYSSPSTSVSGSTKKETGEKNKVKFSDTITVAVVPEIPRKEKSSIASDRSKRMNGLRRIMDPQRELADSLPLCHPNDDYLKDFTPMSDIKPDEDNEDTNCRNNSTIKVVHFGVV